MLTRGRGPSPLRSRTGAAVLAGLFACALLGTAIVRKPAIIDLELDILGFVRNFMNYTSDEWYAQEDASKIGAVKATILKIALPIKAAAGCKRRALAAGAIRAEFARTKAIKCVTTWCMQGHCPAGTKPCEASPLMPVPPPPPMEQCTGCWGFTKGVCQGADTVCYPLVRGHACPPGTFPCGSLPPLDPNKDDDKATIEDLANYQEAFRAEMASAAAAANAINAAGNTVAELPDVGNQYLRTHRGYY